MSEYGSCMTMAEAAEVDKERIIHALGGELVCGESERGFEYTSAPQDECREFILSVLDKWYFLAKQAADAGRTLERMLERRGVSQNDSLPEFIDGMMEAEKEYQGYLDETVKKDLLDEANGFLTVE